MVDRDLANSVIINHLLLLSSTNFPPPERVICHAHWLKDGTDISKWTDDDLVCPKELLQKYGSDCVRTYFLSEGPQADDCEFQESSLQQVNNTFISAQYVNLFKRITREPKVMRAL